MRGAPDPAEEGAVVNVVETGRVELQCLAQFHRQQAGPKEVLHRLTETKISGQRKYGDQLRQPDWATGLAHDRPCWHEMG